MYSKPTLAPLDLATTSASCCRVVVTSGDNTLVTLVNEPLCPFPAPTGTVCVSVNPDSIIVTTGGLAGITACAYPTLG